MIFWHHRQFTIDLPTLPSLLPFKRNRGRREKGKLSALFQRNANFSRGGSVWKKIYLNQTHDCRNHLGWFGLKKWETDNFGFNN